MLASRAFFLAVFLGLLALHPCAGQAPTSAPSLVQAYGALPLTFEPNHGQTHPEVKFLSRGRGYSLYLTQRGIVTALPEQGEDGKSTQHRLAIEFVGANKTAALAGADPLPSRSNYLRGSDPAKWQRNVPHFSAVEYRNLYQGIDVRFYGNGNHFEHDFIVAPGADPAQIHLQIQAPGKVFLNKQGDVELPAGAGQLRLKKPHIYQQKGGNTRIVKGRYVLAGNDVRIKVGKYDKRSPLIIDPVLVYSTYIAGSQGDAGNAIAVDSSGNAYVAGSTFSTDFPTQNPFQASCNSCVNLFSSDVFISKLNSTGTGLIYSTYLGGSHTDEAFSIAVDSAGNAIVAGRTGSSDFPVASPIAVPAGGFQGFVTSISADGSTLNYSTYIGGSAVDSAASVALDTAGNAYVTGTTQSPDFPVTPGTRPSAAPPTAPDTDVFVAKISTAGALQFALTIHGESAPATPSGGTFTATGIAVDSSGNSYLTGSATAGWPTTPGAFQSQSAATGGSTNAFIAKLNPIASDFVYSTYLGGSGPDAAKGIALDQDGNAYVTGDSSSPNFPVTPGAFQTTTAFCCRAFVAKINSSGSGLVYSSLLSGSQQFDNDMNAFAIAVDSAGSAYVVGRTKSQTFPVINPIQAHLPAESLGPDGSSVYLSKFNPAGTALLFSTYFGGSAGTEGRAIAVNPAGTAVYLAGTSFDVDLPTTPDAFQTAIIPLPMPPPVFTRQGHAFAAKLDLSVPAPVACLSNRLRLFLPHRINTTSAPRNVTLTNCGSAPLNVTSLEVLGEFAATHTCGAPLEPQESCTIAVTFTPTQRGSREGQVKIFYDSTATPEKMLLAGAGLAPVVDVNIFKTLNHQLVNTSSPPQTLAVANFGDVDLNISNVQTSGDFTQTNDCNISIPPGFGCFIRITFTPRSVGVGTGSVLIFSDAADSPDRTLLIGTGFAQAPVPSIITLNPPAVLVGSAATTLRITGQDFFPNSVVRLNGVPVPTTFVNDHTLTAAVSASALQQVGEKEVSVFTPGPGGGSSASAFLHVYRSVNLTAADLVFDRVSGKLFASVPSSAPALANTIAVVNPNTGQIENSVPIGSDPADLAISDNGEFLYVALKGTHAIQRLRLATLAKDVLIQLQPVSGLGPVDARDIEVIPGSPRSIVVARERVGTFPNDAGVVVFDDAVKRPSEFAGFSENLTSRDVLAFTSDSSAVYQFVAQSLRQLTVNNSGVSFLRSTSVLSQGSGLASDGSLLYDNAGKIYDPVQLTPTPGVYGFGSPFPHVQQSVVSEPLVGRTFFLTDTYNSERFAGMFLISSILPYDRQTFARIGSIDFPRLGATGNLVRWSSDGFAFTASDASSGTSNIIILRSSLFRSGTGISQPANAELRITRGHATPPLSFKVSVPAAGPVTLSCSGLPLDATCQFTPSAVVNPAPGSPVDATVSIHVPRTAGVGEFNVFVNATVGAQVVSQLIELSVNDYDLAMITNERTAFPGESVSFDGAFTHLFYGTLVNLSCGNGAAALTCSVVPTLGNPLFEGPFTVHASASTVEEHIFEVRGVGTDANATVRSQTLLLHVVDFSLAAFSQTATTLVPGSISTPTTFEVRPLGPLSAHITLTCAGLPAGATCAFNGQPAPVTLSVNHANVPVTFSITASQSVTPGTYPLQIVASAPGRPAPFSSAFQLNVTSGGGATDLSVTATPFAEAVMPGQSVTLALTAANNGSSVSNASLSVSFARPVFVQSAAIVGGGPCGSPGQTIVITCPVGALGTGSTKQVAITVASGFARAIAGQATVSSEFSDSNLLNNAFALSAPVRPRPWVRRGLPAREP